MKNLNPLKPIALAFVICLAFTSCRKKDKIEVSTPQLVKIEQDGGHVLSMSYNADRTISKITTVDGDLLEDTHITYNAEKKPILGTTSTHRLKFVYENGKLKRINTVYTDSDELLGYLEFTYMNDRLSQTLISANVNGQIIGETKLIYAYYPNGDVKQISVAGLDPQDNTFSVLSIHRFEYDQRTNPLLAASQFFSGFDWNPSAHNITKELILNANEEVQETISTTYTYDAKTGMPLTAIEKSQPLGGEPSTITKRFTYN